MLLRSGHLVHLDFGFMLGNSPGRNWGFEGNFKLTPEYLEVVSQTPNQMHNPANNQRQAKSTIKQLQMSAICFVI
jgi:hypothetical protein